jgi:hypothetical protein
MNAFESQLCRILSIGHDTSMRGEGISLRDALHRADYRRVRESFGARDLLPFLRSNPDFIEQWLSYSEDKRNCDGWWVCRENPAVGRVDAPEQLVRFNSVEEAIAEYVVRELDFWSSMR